MNIPSRNFARQGFTRIAALALLPLSIAAHADCAGDFAKDNQVKPAAGPFRASETSEVFMKMNGDWMRARTERATTDTVPPNSMHYRTNAPMSAAELMLIEGKRGWIRESKDGPWEPMPEADRKEMASTSFNAYVIVDEMKNLNCLGQSALNGKPTRAYSYEIPINILGAGIKKVQVYFDNSTGLPVQANVEVSAPTVRIQSISLFTFDKSIRIAPPVSAKSVGIKGK